MVMTFDLNWLEERHLNRWPRSQASTPSCCRLQYSHLSAVLFQIEVCCICRTCFSSGVCMVSERLWNRSQQVEYCEYVSAAARITCEIRPGLSLAFCTASDKSWKAWERGYQHAKQVRNLSKSIRCIASVLH